MRPILFALIVATLLTACEDREIKTYGIARETSETAQLPAPASSAARPQWNVPAGWRELPPSGMRAASFAVEDSKVDVSVVTFPGMAGGLLSNLNRWRSQLGLPDLTSETGLQTISVHGQPAQIVELHSTTEDKAILGAIYLRDDQSWFLKMTGDKASTRAQKEKFEELANSFEFGLPHIHQSTNDG